MAALGAVLGLCVLATLLHGLWVRARRNQEKKRFSRSRTWRRSARSSLTPCTPVVDINRCITSGACVVACPEKEVLAIVSGRATLINPLACVGHAACVQACPVQAIRVVYGAASRGVELPKIDSNFQTTRPGLYVIGELGGMGLIRNAVRQGSQAGQHVSLGARRAKVTMTGTLDFPLYGKVKRRKMPKEELVALWSAIHRETNLPARSRRSRVRGGLRPPWGRRSRGTASARGSERS